jgi:hypothetical protein
MEGAGDEQDKLVTIDVIPNSTHYGKVIHAVSVGGRNEAHHMGFILTDAIYGVPHWTQAKYTFLTFIPILQNRNWLKPLQTLWPKAVGW